MPQKTGSSLILNRHEVVNHDPVSRVTKQTHSRMDYQPGCRRVPKEDAKEQDATMAGRRDVS